MARKSKQSATQESSTPSPNLTDNASAAKWLEQHRAKPARAASMRGAPSKEPRAKPARAAAQLQPGSLWRRTETGQRVQVISQEKRGGAFFVFFFWLEALPPHCAQGEPGAWKRAAFLEEFELEQPAQPSTPVDSESHSVDGAQQASEGAQSGGEVGTRRAQGAGMSKRGKSSSTPEPTVGSYWKLKGVPAVVVVTACSYERARWRVSYRSITFNLVTEGVPRAKFLREFESVPAAAQDSAPEPTEEQAPDNSTRGDYGGDLRDEHEEPAQLEVPQVDTAVLAELEKAGQAIGAEDAAEVLRANGLNWRGMPIPTFSTESAGEVLLGLTGRVHALWCDGCRQSPTMSVDRAARDKDREHKFCPAGKGTWRLLAEVAPNGDEVDLEAVRAARDVCERVFYWLGMGDEGPESDLPCPEEIAQLPGPVAELLEEARTAARRLGGLREEQEDTPYREAPPEWPPIGTQDPKRQAPPADVCAVLNPNGSGFWCDLPKDHPEDDHAGQTDPLTRVYWPRVKGTPTPGEWNLEHGAEWLAVQGSARGVVYDLASRRVPTGHELRSEFAANFRLMAGAPRMAHVLEHKVLPLLRGLVSSYGNPGDDSVLREVVFALQHSGKEVRHVG